MFLTHFSRVSKSHIHTHTHTVLHPCVFIKFVVGPHLVTYTQRTKGRGRGGEKSPVSDMEISFPAAEY